MVTAPTHRMMTMSEPGWYPDPQDDSQERFWNGTEWTEQVKAEEDAAERPVLVPSPHRRQNNAVLWSVLALALCLLVGSGWWLSTNVNQSSSTPEPTSPATGQATSSAAGNAAPIDPAPSSATDSTSPAPTTPPPALGGGRPRGSDEIEKELQIRVRPLSWPIDMGQRFRGVYNIHEGALNLFTPDKQRITESVTITDLNSSELEQHITPEQAEKLRMDLELVDGVYPEFDREEYLSGDIAPVFFGSALNNFGVQELLNCFVEIAPSPRPVKAEEREVSPYEPAFTGFVFKIHANMDPNHRSCIAFIKICSGRFERNASYKHVRLGKSLKFSSPTAFMAQRKETVEEAFAGDIIGLPDTGNFRIGDTITAGEELHFKGLPSFSPELFKYIENQDPMKTKQLAKGIDQLMGEGVAQLFVNQFNGRKIIGTVGQLQFEVIQYRLLHEYGAACRWEPISLYKACWIESDDPEELENFKKRKSQFMAKDLVGRDVYLADSGYVLTMAQQDFPKIRFHFTSEFGK